MGAEVVESHGGGHVGWSQKMVKEGGGRVLVYL